MTATYAELYPGRRPATLWKKGHLRACDWCGLERNVSPGRPNVCLDCRPHEAYAKDDARMVRCPYCDTLKLPETEHECRRAA